MWKLELKWLSTNMSIVWFEDVYHDNVFELIVLMLK
jgi:hypothetical protein